MPYKEQVSSAPSTIDQLWAELEAIRSGRDPGAQMGSVDAQSGYAVNQLTAQAKVHTADLVKLMESALKQSMERVEDTLFYGTNIVPPPSDPSLGVNVRGA